MTFQKSQKVGIIIVAHNCPDQLNKLLKTLKGQVEDDDEIIIVDNHYKHKSSIVAKKFKFIKSILEIENNGLADGCNIGAKNLSKDVELIFILNPDTAIEEGCLKKMRTNIPSNWAAWMGLLIKNDGKVNSAGNIVHMSGLSWCGGFDDNPKNYIKNHEISFLSGACTMIRASIFKKIGGMPKDYFLYYEDTALSSKLSLMGLQQGIVPTAHIFHDYDYTKSKTKWFYIERNRYIYIATCWPTVIILLMIPYLAIIELGLLAISVIDKRFLLKLKASASFLKLIPKLSTARENVQKNRKITSYVFFTQLSPRINTMQLGNQSKFWLINVISNIYFYIVKIILKIFNK